MTNRIAAQQNASKLGPFAVGFVVGILLGIATSFLFLMVIAAPFLGIATSVIGLRAHPPDLSRSAAGAGVLLGSGGFYLYGAINTLISCYGSSECGGASALPFLAWALVIVTVGIVIAAMAFRRRT